MSDVERWLAAGKDRFDFPPAVDDGPVGDEMITLSLLNRDKVIAFLVASGVHAHEPDDLGSDVVHIDLPSGRRQIVMLGELVTRLDDEITIGRNGGIRARVPRDTA